MSTSTLANTAQVLLDSMTPKFAVSYLRVSTRGQAERGGGHDEGFSIPAQREANKKKAMSMGAIVGKEFVDRGASAKSADRPQLQAMLEYVKENADRVDYVIVHIFEKFYISNGPEDEFGVKLTFKAPYDQILDPIKEDLSQINTALKRKPEAVDGLADKAKGHIHDFFGCGTNLGQNKNPYSNESDFFNPNSSSKDLMEYRNTIDAKQIRISRWYTSAKDRFV